MYNKPMNTIEIEREDIIAICDDKIRRVENVKLGINNVAFHPPVPIYRFIPNKPIGVYIIRHKSYGILYIGSGNIEQRRAQHIRIFKNGGKPQLYTSGKGNISKVDSACGQKMYELDPNESNWTMQWMLVDREIMEDIEMGLIKKYNPRFNVRKSSKSKVQLNEEWFKYPQV
jgi:hypothetical protein